MFINDVGRSAWEEINDGIAGANYGWPASEGPTTDPNFWTPLFLYGHGSSLTTGCAIKGGAFYNPATVQFPSTYVGKYFFADFCSGWVRTLDPANIPSATNPASAPGFISGLANPVDLKVTPGGSLLILTRGNGSLIGIKYPAPPAGPTIAHPSSTRIVNGNLRSGSAASLAANDNSFYQVNTASGFKTSWYASMTNVPNTANNLKLTYSGSNSVACSQTLQAFDFNSRAWVNRHQDGRPHGSNRCRPGTARGGPGLREPEQRPGRGPPAGHLPGRPGHRRLLLERRPRGAFVRRLKLE